jgi:hypothetical protein
LPGRINATAMTQLRKVADGLRTRFARAAALLEEAAEDVLAYRFVSERAPTAAAQHECARPRWTPKSGN